MDNHPGTAPRRRSVAWYFCALAATSLLLVRSAHAQDPAPPDTLALKFAAANLPEGITPKAETPAASPAIQPRIQPKNDRLFFILPNYLSVENHVHVAPISTGTKFKLSEKTMTDPVTVSFLGVVALMGQAQNTNPSYGQGLQGYGKRYATVYTDTAIGTVMTTSVFPTLLRQDPRYFQLGSGGAWHRTLYAVSRIFITRSDAGATQFNYSEIVGNAVAAGISNTYHPQDQRTFSNTLSIWGTDIMLNTLCNVAKEFWPDLRRKLHKPKAD